MTERRKTEATVGLAVIALLATSPSSGFAAGGPSLGAEASRLGIRLYDPPAMAPPFQLTSTGGRVLDPAQTDGKWILLTFFASWCGPCKSEMPTLQRLSQDQSDVEVWGVSVEPDPEAARRFAERYGVTFPVAPDTSGKVATAYRASSIPTSYLIDPEGNLRGLARGARDWSSFRMPMDRAPAGTAVPPPKPSAPVHVVAPLPNVSNPPEIRLVPMLPETSEGTPFPVVLEVTWSGNFSEYLLHPPRWMGQDGQPKQTGERGAVELLRTAAQTGSKGGRTQVSYTLTFVSHLPGSQLLGDVQLAYTPAGESEPLTQRLSLPTVEVRPKSGWGWWPLGLGALLGLGGLGAGVGRRARRPKPDQPRDDSALEAAAILQQLREARMRGDGVAFMSGAQTVLKSEGGAPLSEVDYLLEKARYGGYVPTSPELDRIERAVTRLIDHGTRNNNEEIS